MKRVVTMGDLHCGHAVGLAHPDYIPKHKAAKHHAAVLTAMWGFYAATIGALQPVDILIVNGDLVDGQGTRSSGVEQLYTDMNTQCEMATRAIDYAQAKSIVITAGTPYHVNGQDGTDYEKIIAGDLDAKFGGHEWVDVNGLIFDVKHKIGGSSVPHGRHTAIARERLWNLLWNYAGGALESNIILRSHVHYHNFCGGPGWLGMTLPALQGPGSRYGVRQCSGVVDFGLVSFDVDEKGGYKWTAHTMAVRAALPKAIKL